MILSKLKPSVKRTSSDKEREKRLKRNLKPSTQNSIYYTSLFEDGLMHVTDDVWSQTYELGDIRYTTADIEDKENIIQTCAKAVESLAPGDNFQLTVINRKREDNIVDSVMYDLKEDELDLYREGLNQLIKQRNTGNQKAYQTDKYVTISKTAFSREMAENQLYEKGVALETIYNGIDLDFRRLTGMERLSLFSGILRKNYYPPYTYNDIRQYGFKTKDFIAPDHIFFNQGFMTIDQRPHKVLYIREYPSSMSDGLIKSLTDTGVEFILALHASPHDPSSFSQNLKNISLDIKGEISNQQSKSLLRGIVDPELAVGAVTKEYAEACDKWISVTKPGQQKAYSGLIAICIFGEDETELDKNEAKIKAAASQLHATFTVCFLNQELGLNTILPIGKPFLSVKREFERPFTTGNVVTQVPFSNIDLQSQSDRALYYGQNQLTNNIITLDRKKDLNAANGVVFGTSGSGKGTTTKSLEIIPSYLKHDQDRFIIIDPENEYSDICREVDGQIIDIYSGSNTHINILDLPDLTKLGKIDPGNTLDPIGDKSDLLISIFETILSEVSDEDIGLIDRVTRRLYKSFEDKERVPTLVDWNEFLLQESSPRAKTLSNKLEPYVKGSQSLFAHETNVDLNKRMINFNLKQMKDGKLKEIALLVLQDFIWNEVIACQGILTLWIYWDETQIFFKRQNQAEFFSDSFARFRKYGAIPTAITQNIITIASTEEGMKMLSNCEFMILLKHKKQDLQVLKKVITNFPTALEKYLLSPTEKGSGLILADKTIVPFKNNIPKDSPIYKLVNTDV